MSTSQQIIQLLNNNIFIVINICCFILILFYFYLKFVRIDPRVKELVDKIPGPKTKFMVGNAFDLMVQNHEILREIGKCFSEFDGFFRGWAGNMPYVFAGKAEAAEKLLTSSVHIEKGRDYSLLENWLGTGLLTSKGKKWHQRRKLLTPTFHFKILEDFFEIFNEQSLILVDILQEMSNEQKTIIDICPFITRCTLDIICETAMGEKINAQRNSESEYVKALYGTGELFMSRLVKPWLKSGLIWKVTLKEKLERKYLRILHDFTETVIQRRKAERSQARRSVSKSQIDEDDDDSSIYFRQKKRRLAFLDLLLDSTIDGNGLSDMDIREETDTFMFEGHDTTASSLNWTIFLLACNPECQKKVRNEITEVFSQTENERLRHSDLAKLSYLECCIKEAMRMYPPVPFIARHITQDFDMGDGIIIPAGVEFVVCPSFIHRDPKYYPNPDQFMPERFYPENCANRNPYAYIPFSAGPRNCIGQKFALMEEKVILSNVFRHIWFEPKEKLEDLKIVPDIVLRPLNGLHVKFTAL